MKNRIIALALLAVILIATFCSCTNTTDPDEPSEITDDASSSPVADSVSDSPSDDSGSGTVGETSIYETPDDLGEMNLNKKVNILCWNPEMTDFEVKEASGDLIDDAIYTRNLTVESRLGVELNWIEIEGDFNKREEFIKNVEEGRTSREYDLIACYSLTSAPLALRGLSSDLLEFDYLDFDKPWWPSALVDQATINGKLYFASGDISTNYLHMMYATFFNKTMLEEYNFTNDAYKDLYKLTIDKGWTIDALIEMSSIVSGENGAGTIYGFAIKNINYDAFLTGSDLKTLVKTDDGIVLSEDFTSGKTINLADKIVDFISNPYVYNAGSGSAAKPFAENRALFTIDRAYLPTSSGHMQKAGDDIVYGVIPVPLYDSKQDNYVTVLGFPYSMYQIASYSSIQNESAAVMECLAAEGLRRVTPALYEVSMKIKYTSDTNAAKMFDLIKSTVYIDLGRIFAMECDEWTYQTFRYVVQNKSRGGYRMLSKQKQTTINNALKNKINPAFFGK